jgi:cell division inhibitor SulA
MTVLSLSSDSFAQINPFSRKAIACPPRSPAVNTPSIAGVTELVLSRECPDQLALLLPMLAHISHQSEQRWITWVAPQGIHRDRLADYGIDIGKIRLVHAKKTHDILRITWEALARGNSHTVLASPGKLTDHSYTQLEMAANVGHSQGLLLRMR